MLELDQLQEAQNTYWDFYKEAYGVRPRASNTQNWTLQDFDKEFETLAEVCRLNAVHRAQAEAEATDRFERTVLTLLESGARDRAMALRWLHEANDTQGDASYLEYLLGLPYQYLRA